MRIIINFLILGSIALIIFIFGPILKEELKYSLNSLSKVKFVVATEQLSSFEKPLSPPNEDFSIIIPKIAAVAPIIADVDSQNKNAYLSALKKGVAHAKGTAYPGEPGNVYLFAHSTDTFYNIGRYNAVFYLIGKLDKGDEIDIFYQGRQIKYEVYDKKIVPADETKYLGSISDSEDTLTLQTCYPPGTDWKRLIVVAKQKSQ